MNSSTLCNSWHKLSNGDSAGLVSMLSSADDDDDDDDEEEEESVANDEVEADGERVAAWRTCR